MPEIVCHCGKKRWIAPAKLARLKAKPTCSRACRSVQMKGKAHWNWTGGRYTDAQGYVRVRTTSGTVVGRVTPRGGEYEYEHVVVAAKKLGRPLFDNERVKHKDGDRENNKPGNLEIYTVDGPKRRRRPHRPAA